MSKKGAASRNDVVLGEAVCASDVVEDRLGGNGCTAQTKGIAIFFTGARRDDCLTAVIARAFDALCTFFVALAEPEPRFHELVDFGLVHGIPREADVCDWNEVERERSGECQRMANVGVQNLELPEQPIDIAHHVGSRQVVHLGVSRGLCLDDGIDEDVEDVREHGAAHVVGQPVDAEREQALPRRHSTGNPVTRESDLKLPDAGVLTRHALEDREHEVCMATQVVGVRHTVCVRHCVPHCFHVTLRNQAALRE